MGSLGYAKSLLLNNTCGTIIRDCELNQELAEKFEHNKSKLKN